MLFACLEGYRNSHYEKLCWYPKTIQNHKDTGFPEFNRTLPSWTRAQWLFCLSSFFSKNRFIFLLPEAVMKKMYKSHRSRVSIFIATELKARGAQPTATLMLPKGCSSAACKGLTSCLHARLTIFISQTRRLSDQQLHLTGTDSASCVFAKIWNKN